MAKQFQWRRGTSAQHSTFTGAVGEVTVDTTKDTLVVHDGSTAGGFPLAKEDLSNYDGSIISGFESTGIDDNATSTAITIDSSDRVGIGTTNQTAPLSLAAARDGDGTTTAPKFNMWFPIADVPLKNADANFANISDANNTELVISPGTDVLLTRIHGVNLFISPANPMSSAFSMAPTGYKLRARLWFVGDMNLVSDSSTGTMDLRCRITNDLDNAGAWRTWSVTGIFDHQFYNARSFFLGPWMRWSESNLGARNSHGLISVGVEAASSNGMILTRCGLQIAYVAGSENT